MKTKKNSRKAEFKLDGAAVVQFASQPIELPHAAGAVAASAGIRSPILTYWISGRAGSAQGGELGKQPAAASLGGTVGSAAGGLLFNFTTFPGASFVLTAVLAALDFMLSLGLPHLLMAANASSHGTSA